MEITSYHVDAFTKNLFSGNPTKVCILSEWLPDITMQKLAEEHNLAATVFLLPQNKKYFIRWFAPEYEIDLCGQGTLAAAYIIFNHLEPDLKQIDITHIPTTQTFRTAKQDNQINFCFPIKAIEPITIPDWMVRGLGVKPIELYQYKKERCLAIFESEEIIAEMLPNREILKQMEHRGIIVSALGKTSDFVFRVFYPKKNIFEDPATGSAFCLLLPYWSEKLNKTQFYARQLSQRQGEMNVAIKKNCVLVSGEVAEFSRGTIYLDKL